MGTTAEKLTYLNTTKQNLKTVINTTGAGLTDESTFRSYANLLNDKILGAINGDVDLFEEYPKVSGNGIDVSLNGVVEGKMSITPQGVSSQDGEPTPTTPVPVKSVTGENSLVIENVNLFNKNSITPNSYLDSDGNIITNTSWSISDYIPVIAGEDYVYRWLTTVGNAPRSCYYDKNKNFVSSFKQTTSGTRITIPSNVKFVRFTIETKNTDDLNTFMFIKGSTAPSTYIANQTQTYQLSLGNIELNSSPDGTIRDQIVGKPNEWYKREYIGKVVLDGSESYSRASSSSSRIAYETNIADIISYTNPSNTPDLISNRFTPVSYNASWKIGNISRWTNRYSLVLIVDPSISTILDFKQWLSENNVTVWYQKSEYTDIPITDTTLINQLNDIYNNAHSYNGVTNITTTYEDGNKQMYLDIEALKNVWEVTE
jgi:hypothetical protein